MVRSYTEKAIISGLSAKAPKPLKTRQDKHVIIKAIYLALDVMC